MPDVAITENCFQEKVLFAGFGGQGVMLVGKLLAQAVMKSGYEVTYMPSYGAEVRGGTANSMVVISEEIIASPLVNTPDSLIVLSKASLNKFGPRLKPGGLLVFNSSRIDRPPDRTDIEILAVPADEIALELHAPKSTNMVALGAYLQKRGRIAPATAIDSLPEILAQRYHNTIPVNKQAILAGAEID